ncbi:MAG TPA: hypothetical protein VF188_16655 [Longimicrobiales bacterium]
MRITRWLAASAVVFTLVVVPVEWQGQGAPRIQTAEAACYAGTEVCYKEKFWIFYRKVCSTVLYEVPCFA